MFVPANNPKLMAKAPQLGADALIIDLEDAVPADQKPAARRALRDQGSAISAAGAAFLVRVNNDHHLSQDVDALPLGTVAVVLPGAESPDQLQALDGLLSKHERSHGLQPGVVGVVPLIESPAALASVHDIAFGSRVMALALGSEDFSLALGAPPSPMSLTLPAQLVCLAAAAARVAALAIPYSIAAYRDEAGWTAAAQAAKAFGATGGLCIHPAQVSLLNAVFLPTEAELEWAQDVITAWAQAQAAGSGIATLNGRMIDRPVFERALAMSRMKPDAR